MSLLFSIAIVLAADAESVASLTRAAATARYQQKDPRLAIETYRRAAVLHAREYPAFGGIAFLEEIADIQQFDLGDRAAAAASLEELRKQYPNTGPHDELAALHLWKRKWLDAEIAYLRTGKPFDGAIDAALAGGIFPQLYYGYGAATAAGGLADPVLDPGREITLTPVQIEKKLAALPPSHGMFMRTWTFAAQLPTAASARKWLARNDPGGFWTASLLTLVAVFDRNPAALDDAEVVRGLMRTESGQPTGFALLSREYAKTHAIPKANLKFGH